MREGGIGGQHGCRPGDKIKMLKRQMYGRASFSLLRKRVIFHPD